MRAQWPIPSVAVIFVIAFALVAAGFWRRGSLPIGIAVGLAAVLRLVLSDERAGLPAVRSKSLDFATMVTVCAVMVHRLDDRPAGHQFTLCARLRVALCQEAACSDGVSRVCRGSVLAGVVGVLVCQHCQMTWIQARARFGWRWVIVAPGRGRGCRGRRPRGLAWRESLAKSQRASRSSRLQAQRNPTERHFARLRVEGATPARHASGLGGESTAAVSDFGQQSGCAHGAATWEAGR